MSDPERLKRFLVNLAIDPKMYNQYITEAESVMNAAELDEEEKALLKSGNSAAILAYITASTDFTPFVLLRQDIVKLVPVTKESVEKRYKPDTEDENKDK